MTTIDDNMSLDAAVPSESKYLKKEDVGIGGQNLKIASLSRIDMNDGERKTVLNWTDSTVKPMVLNKTNKNRLAMVLKADTVGELIGKVINVYNDPLVEYGGKMTGGVRIRAEVIAGQPEGGNMSREQAIDKHGTDSAPDDDIPF